MWKVSLEATREWDILMDSQVDLAFEHSKKRWIYEFFLYINHLWNLSCKIFMSISVIKMKIRDEEKENARKLVKRWWKRERKKSLKKIIVHKNFF